MQNHEIRIQNELRALRFVHQFGWLRIVDLSTLMKPSTATALEAGARLARHLIQRRLVLARRLPEGAGQALVLATAGVRLLAEHGIHASSGKSIGEIIGEQWMPPTDWKHTCLAHGVLCELFKQGYQVLPEATIRRICGDVTKLPDGLVQHPESKQWLWLEVENARKSGPHMQRLANAIVAVSNGQVSLCGVQPSGSLVAYWQGSVDERGYQLNHRSRVSKAVGNVAKQDVPITFIACTRKGAVSLSRLEFFDTRVEADRTSAVLTRLNANGWQLDEETGVSSAHYGSDMAHVWQDADTAPAWSYHADGQGWSAYAGYADSMSEAKRCAAALIANR